MAGVKALLAIAADERNYVAPICVPCSNRGGNTAISKLPDEQYISREEHQEIVDYYKKQSMQFYRKLCDLRRDVDARNLEAMVEHAKHRSEREARKTEVSDEAGNIIRVDFRRQ